MTAKPAAGADSTVYRLCAFLPLMGLLAVLLPDIKRASPPVEPAPILEP